MRLAAIAAATGVIAAVMATAALAAGMKGAGPAEAARSPQMRLGWPGAWIIPEESFIRSVSSETDPHSPEAPALTARYAKRLGAFHFRQLAGKDLPGFERVRTNSERCLPAGMPDVMRYPAAIEFLFTPGRVTMISEEPTIRRIYTDGRAHPPGADATFAGDSIGHWEGDTLVVDTTAISSEAGLIGPVHTSGEAHVIERMHLIDRRHLQIDTVVEDPIVLRRPWRYSRVYEHLDSAPREYVCLENDRDPGGGEPDLTPPH